MERKTGKLIEIIVLLVGILLTAAVVIILPLNSYNEYKVYREKLIELSKPEPKPILESISVQLKEGVKYFKNDLAQPKVDDFVVTANYTLEGAPYSEAVEAGKFSIATEPDFYAVGGDIKITYKGKVQTLSIELIPVKIESLSIVQNPYTVKYQTGSTFDANGLIISAIYNDGSTKVIPAEKYVFDTEKILLTGDSSISVSYTEDEQVNVLQVPIGVVDVLDNGTVTKLIVTSDAIVEAGSKLSTAQMEINAVYESGNRLPLDKSKYVVSGGDTVAKFGKAYTVSVSYIDNPEVATSTGVIVCATLQGEKGTIVGGKTSSEYEYSVVDGAIQKLGNKVSFAGDFSKSVRNGNEGSLTFTLTSESSVISNITMRAGNSYCCYANGADAAAGFIMKPLQVNTILDLIINGQVVEIPDSVVLKGSGPHGDYGALYNIYYEFTFENIALDPGENKIKIKFKNSTNSAANLWGESPSTLNVDYIKVDTVGNEIPDDFVIEKIEMASNYTVQINQRFDRVKPIVYAVLENGVKVMVPQDLFEYSVSGGEEGATRVTYGKYTITATLKSNPEVKATRDLESIGVKVRNVRVEQEGDKVYYVFSGTYYGCTAEDLQFFDGTKVYDLITEFTDTTVVFKIDVTALPADVTIYPHLKVQGVNYYNGGNNENGDILGSDLSFIDNQSVTFNGLVYKIVRAYSMPTLQISKAE